MRHIDGIAKIGMIHARDVLDNIIAGRNGEERDLTRTYYARKTLKRLQRGWVLDQWRAYRTNSQSFPIWQGCGLMAMFSNHEMELSDIDRLLQDLADEFLEISPLQSVDRGLPAMSPTIITPNNFDRYGPGSFSTSPDNRLGPERNGSDSSSNKRSRYYETQIDRLKQLIQFFTQEKGFKGNTDNYYDPFNSFIDKVLVRKLGIPISLCIVFDELARRVGIVGVELMGFPQHFMIRYRPQAPIFDPTTSPLLSSEASASPPPPAPPTYFLDLFHPPHRLLSTEEYEDYFTRLSVPRPPNIYRDLPTPPLEIFLRCLRNIILAVEQTGGAGRIGSDHQASLYSGITQLLALHPGEEWGLYVLWLKYLSNFWPEDIGFIRTSIKDMEWTDHRRLVARGQLSSSSPPPNHGQSQHIFGYNQGVIYNTEYAGAGPSTHFTSSTHETIKILRAQVRELEIADEVGEVGHIRRRRRPRVVPASAARATNQSSISQQYDTAVESNEDEAQSPSAGNPITSSPTIDEPSSHARHGLERQNSIFGEQQNGSTSSFGENSEIIANEYSSKVATTFGGEERRRPEPEYYVGEVFRHLIYRYPGAIYGYDLKCEAEEEWIRSMAIDTLKHGRHQPFYNALLSDGSRRYVAQENIHVLYREYRNTDASASTPVDQILSSSTLNAASTSMPENVDTSIPSSQSSLSTSSSSLSAPTPGETDSSSAPLVNLQYSELGPLGIEAVGQYFEAWDGQHGHYVMNKELRKLYPTEDYAQ
ncbi:hypothetical protein BGX26_012730 [Mortierella sp. AD094]|nr:hypothetical protein BGX26_012730 [Mortierella sp. AD094]